LENENKKEDKVEVSELKNEDQKTEVIKSKDTKETSKMKVELDTSILKNNAKALTGWQLILAFILGMATPLSPVLQEWVKSDTERRVLDGIVEERKALMENQSEYLKLQEIYMSKLKILNEKEIDISQKNVDLGRLRDAQIELRNSYEERIKSLESIEMYCPTNNSQKSNNTKKPNTNKLSSSVVSTYKHHRCTSNTDYDNESIFGEEKDCRVFHKVTFNIGGPDEKTFEKGRKYPGTCNYVGDQQDKSIRNTLMAMCKTYQHEYFKSKNIKPSQIDQLVFEITKKYLQDRADMLSTDSGRTTR